jgi:hypothetical protein
VVERPPPVGDGLPLCEEPCVERPYPLLEAEEPPVEYRWWPAVGDGETETFGFGLATWPWPGFGAVGLAVGQTGDG